MASLSGIRYRNGSAWVQLLNLVYPVGSIYLANKAMSPASFAGGTWALISNSRYLRLGGSFTTGGSASSSHNHSASNLVAALSVCEGRGSYTWWKAVTGLEPNTSSAWYYEFWRLSNY